MDVRPTTSNDLEPTVQALVSAFASDPLIGFLFAESRDRDTDLAEFFRVLLDVRVALAMPAFTAAEGGQALGGVMGYDTSRPTWTDAQVSRWNHLMATAAGLEPRLAEYEALAERFTPPVPHYYLGVIGVRVEGQGRGVGGALLTAFCALSQNDPGSGGVFLETSSEASLRFYLSHGFELCGEGTLGRTTPLWCVFQPRPTTG